MPDQSTMATITGSVSNNGKAITTDSDVVFYCTEKSATASGKVDSLGKFSLTGADPHVGIPAGRYVVTLSPPPPPAVQMGTEDYKKMMSAGMGSGGVTKAALKPSDIPERFRDPTTSKLLLEVKAGPNNFDIDLAKIGE